ncbi:MAG: DUF1254 domain-containing protein [Ktedonobacteraceae bacterium]
MISMDEMNEEYAYAVGLQAYVWGYPMVNLWNRRTYASQVPEPGRSCGMVPVAPVNSISVLTDYVNWEEQVMVCPNHDTVYGEGFMDLTDDAVVFQWPDTGGRYWTWQVMDGFTNVLKAPGKQTAPGTISGSSPGLYLVVGPHWQGGVPAEVVEVIRSPTNLAWTIPRVCKAYAGDQSMRAIMNGIWMKPLRAYLACGPSQEINYDEAPDFPTHDNSGRELNFAPSETFWEVFSAALALTQVPESEVALKATFGTLLARRDERGVARGLTRALEEGEKLLERAAFFGNLGKRYATGWTALLSGRDWGTDYLGRCGAAKAMIAVNLSKDAVYYQQVFDADGKELDSAGRYVLHFEPWEMPPVKAFWSITMYDQHHFLVRNQLNRSHLGTVPDQTLAYNYDTSLDLYIQRDKPETHLNNWLPAPREGSFALVMRAYGPEVPILSGSYVPPAVHRLG